MLVKVKKWINSLVVRTPMACGEEVTISEISGANKSSRDGSICIKPVDDNYNYKLDDLIGQVNNSNLQGEYNSGKPLGKEIW